MAYQEVFILGATGNVGAETVKQIEEKDGLAGGHENPTRIVGMANSRGYICAPNGIKNASSLTDRDAFRNSPMFSPYEDCENSLDEIRRTVEKSGLRGETVYVDVTAEKSEKMLQMHKAIVASKGRIVTANKNPISLFKIKDFHELTDERHLYGYNPTVMAGGDGVRFLTEALDTRERIHEIQGCFSGTLGYINSALDKNEIPFSEIVRQAYYKRYTEPHPYDDLNGLDVARKLLILARSGGFDVKMKSIELKPFIPDEYGQHKDVEAFLNAIRAEDDRIDKMVKQAKKERKVLRYIAELSNLVAGEPAKLSTGLKAVSEDTPLGRLQGTANLIQIITSERAPEACPHIIQTKGAGIERTAGAVRANLLAFLEHYRN